MIRITCTSCQKPLSLDETKLPMKEVSFPCPVCKTKLTVDRRKLGGEAPPPQAVEQVAVQPEADDHEDEFGSKAFIVGNDNPALRQAAKLIGCLPVYLASAAEARDRFMHDTPQVILISPPQITPPPLEAMQPILSLMPAERRKSFFVLVAENLRTFDGNAAFLYGVNLVVAPRDLGSFPQIYREAHSYHERLYASMNAALKAIETV
ncbi:MAG TPA: hypothetical protein VF980_17395 [Thermoanaerobaculia bacterium]